MYTSLQHLYLHISLALWGPGGVGRDLGSDGEAKLCTWELAAVVSRCIPFAPVVSRGLPLFWLKPKSKFQNLPAAAAKR